MSIGQKFKAVFGKLRRKNDDKQPQKRGRTDAELSAEEVIDEEIFPKGKRVPKSKAEECKNAKATKKSSGRTCRARIDNSGKADRLCEKIEAAEDAPRKKQKSAGSASPVRGKGAVKPTHYAGRNRPANDNYEMIDPSNDSADAGKS